MNIEKVSKYINVRSGISCGPGDGRRVLLSLPRVQWLERQPDYAPWPPLEKLKPEPEPEQEHQPARYTFRPQLRNNELSVRQRQAWNLHLAGMSMKQIGEKMDCTDNAASKLVAQARDKLGVGLDK